MQLAKTIEVQTPSRSARKNARRVLVVSASLARRKILAKLLRRIGCRTMLSKPGRRTAALVRRMPFHLVVMDLHDQAMDEAGFSELVYGLSVAFADNNGGARPAFLLLAPQAQEDMHGSAFLHENLVGVLRKPIGKKIIRRMARELLHWEARLRTERAQLEAR